MIRFACRVQPLEYLATLSTVERSESDKPHLLINNPIASTTLDPKPLNPNSKEVQEIHNFVFEIPGFSCCIPETVTSTLNNAQVEIPQYRTTLLGVIGSEIMACMPKNTKNV